MTTCLVALLLFLAPTALARDRSAGLDAALDDLVGKVPRIAHGECGWAGAASTAFSIAPGPDLIVIKRIQFMPFNVFAHGTAKNFAYAAVTAKPAR